MPYFVALLVLPGVAFSNSSMTSFSFTPVRSDFRRPPLFLKGKLFSSLLDLS